jgi:hypothetical protein
MGYIAASWYILSSAFNRETAQRIFFAYWKCIGVTLSIFIIILSQGAYQQHYALLIPLFTSLALFCSKELAKENTIASPQWACFLLSGICAACGIFLLPKTDYQSVLSYQKKQEEKAQAAALQIDNLMTSCGYDRYVVFGKGEDSIPYGYTHHSPMGPGFFRTSDTFPVKWRNPPTPYLQNTYRERLHTAPFVIANKIVIDGKPLVDATDVSDDVWNEFAQNFTATPPPCAEQYPEMAGMLFRFRKN